MNDNFGPDPFEKRLRFGCGSLFGAFIALFYGLREIAAFTSGFWAFVVFIALLFGFLAMRYGDEFWHQLSNWFRWW